MFSEKCFLAEDCVHSEGYKLHPIFCFHCLSSCPEAVDCFNFHSSDKLLLCRRNSSSCKHSETAETIFVMAVFYATLYTCFLLLIDISGMSHNLWTYEPQPQLICQDCLYSGAASFLSWVTTSQICLFAHGTECDHDPFKSPFFLPPATTSITWNLSEVSGMVVSAAFLSGPDVP